MDFRALWTNEEAKSMIVIVSSDDGQIEEYASLTRANKQAYAERWGYEHHHMFASHFPDVSPEWNLVRAMKDNMDYVLATLGDDADENDWIFLTGADACFVTMDIPLQSVVDEYAADGIDILATKDRCGFNNNGMFIRNNAWGREFIERVWVLRGKSFVVHTGHRAEPSTWQEQGAMIYVLGIHPVSEYVTEDGAHVPVGRLDVKPMEDGLSHVVWIPQELTNGYPSELYGDFYKEPQIMVHLPGQSTAVRAEFFKKLLCQ